MGRAKRLTWAMRAIAFKRLPSGVAGDLVRARMIRKFGKRPEFQRALAQFSATGGRADV